MTARLWTDWPFGGLEEIDRYGPAIEADLSHHHRIDLMDYIRGERTWRNLATLLEYMPRPSAYLEARAMDEEAAEEAIRNAGGHEVMQDRIAAARRSTDGPPLREEDPVVAMVRVVADSVRDLTALVANMGSKSDIPPPAPIPTPRTALEKAIDRHEDAALAAFAESLPIAGEGDAGG